MHYSPEVVVVSLPCTSGVRPSWILFALEQGFDGVFIASDGDECAYLSDCAQRSARMFNAAQELLAEHQIDDRRLKMAAICSVCAESFTRQIREFTDVLSTLEAA
jgi:F420-non-reducing hydrogenase iron-sulfur subunit